MRTYSIVPLSPVAGVIEWVEHSVPLGGYLYGDRAVDPKSARKKIKPKRSTLGAHARYYPDDLSHSDCRAALQEAQSEQRKQRKKSGAKLVEAFSHVCARFHPVLRFFFLAIQSASRFDKFESRDCEKKVQWVSQFLNSSRKLMARGRFVLSRVQCGSSGLYTVSSNQRLWKIKRDL